MSNEIECYGDPLLQLVTFHEGGREWHDGPGWYYTINDYPDEGSCGAFVKFSDAMEHAEEAMFGDLPKKPLSREGMCHNDTMCFGTCPGCRKLCGRD